jgi:predicted 2-oxoglutarate/Fe(II)-dependent dioxygenase YbiX
MHSGFAALRTACGINIQARLPERGAIVWRDQSAVRADAKLRPLFNLETAVDRLLSSREPHKH